MQPLHDSTLLRFEGAEMGVINPHGGRRLRKPAPGKLPGLATPERSSQLAGAGLGSPGGAELLSPPRYRHGGASSTELGSPVAFPLPDAGPSLLQQVTRLLDARLSVEAEAREGMSRELSRLRERVAGLERETTEQARIITEQDRALETLRSRQSAMAREVVVLADAKQSASATAGGGGGSSSGAAHAPEVVAAIAAATAAAHDATAVASRESKERHNLRVALESVESAQRLLASQVRDLAAALAAERSSRVGSEDALSTRLGAVTRQLADVATTQASMATSASTAVAAAAAALSPGRGGLDTSAAAAGGGGGAGPTGSPGGPLARRRARLGSGGAGHPVMDSVADYFSSGEDDPDPATLSTRVVTRAALETALAPLRGRLDAAEAGQRKLQDETAAGLARTGHELGVIKRAVDEDVSARVETVVATVTAAVAELSAKARDTQGAVAALNAAVVEEKGWVRDSLTLLRDMVSKRVDAVEGSLRAVEATHIKREQALGDALLRGLQQEQLARESFERDSNARWTSVMHSVEGLQGDMRGELSRLMSESGAFTSTAMDSLRKGILEQVEAEKRERQAETAALHSTLNSGLKRDVATLQAAVAAAGATTAEARAELREQLTAEVAALRTALAQQGAKLGGEQSSTAAALAALSERLAATEKSMASTQADLKNSSDTADAHLESMQEWLEKLAAVETEAQEAKYLAKKAREVADAAATQAVEGRATTGASEAVSAQAAQLAALAVTLEQLDFRLNGLESGHSALTQHVEEAKTTAAAAATAASAAQHVAAAAPAPTAPAPAPAVPAETVAAVAMLQEEVKDVTARLHEVETALRAASSKLAAQAESVKSLQLHSSSASAAGGTGSGSGSGADGAAASSAVAGIRTRLESLQLALDAALARISAVESGVPPVPPAAAPAASDAEGSSSGSSGSSSADSGALSGRVGSLETRLTELSKQHADSFQRLGAAVADTADSIDDLSTRFATSADLSDTRSYVERLVEDAKVEAATYADSVKQELEAALAREAAARAAAADGAVSVSEVDDVIARVKAGEARVAELQGLVADAGVREEVAATLAFLVNTVADAHMVDIVSAVAADTAADILSSSGGGGGGGRERPASGLATGTGTPRTATARRGGRADGMASPPTPSTAALAAAAAAVAGS